MKSTYKSYAAATAVVAIASLALALPAFAQVPAVTGGLNASVNTSAHISAGANADGRMGGPGRGPGMMNGSRPAVFGTVSSVTGSTIVVSARGFGPNTASTTYSVDASNAVIFKNNATSSISSVAVGDSVFVQGTVSGTAVTATTVRDGMLMMNGQANGRKGGPWNGQGSTTPKTAMPTIKGNGQPVVAGTVSSVNGSTVAITTTSNTSYQIDASAATVTKGNATDSISSIAVGDYVVVQGAVNGSSVTATSIIDGQSSAQGQNPGNSQAPRGGFLGSVGQFFRKIFGF